MEAESMKGRKGFVNGVYVVKVDGFPRTRFFFFSAREAEREYRRQHGLKGKHIEWRPAYY